MDLYDLLREIVEDGVRWRDEGRKLDALALIAELERTAALGTLASTTESVVHEHRWEWRPDGAQYGYPARIKWCPVCGMNDLTSNRQVYRNYAWKDLYAL